MAQSGHSDTLNQCSLSGVKRHQPRWGDPMRQPVNTLQRAVEAEAHE